MRIVWLWTEPSSYRFLPFLLNCVDSAHWRILRGVSLDKGQCVSRFWLFCIDCLHVLELLFLISTHNFPQILRDQDEPSFISLVDLLVADPRENLETCSTCQFLSGLLTLKALMKSPNSNEDEVESFML